jgi:hypothetical protein
MTKTNKNKTQHRKKMSTTDTTKDHLEPRCPTSYTVTNIDKSCKNLLGDRGKKEIYVEGKQSIAI